jgi:hypothetical protein
MQKATFQRGFLHCWRGKNINNTFLPAKVLKWLIFYIFMS